MSLVGWLITKPLRAVFINAVPTITDDNLKIQKKIVTFM